MSLKKCECIILRGDKFSETKKIVTFYSPEYGRKKGVASGLGKMKSRFGGSLEVITYSSLIFFENVKTDLHRISQCDTIEPFQNIKTDLDRLQPAIYLTELVRECVPEAAPSPEIFKLFLFFLKIINGDEKPPSKTLLRIFEIRLLKILGVLPPMDFCLQCKKTPYTKTNFFDSSKSGIICAKCNNKSLPSLTRGGSSFIKTAGTLPLNKVKSLILKESQEKEVRNVLHLIILSFIGKDLHSFRFLYHPRS